MTPDELAEGAGRGAVTNHSSGNYPAARPTPAREGLDVERLARAIRPPLALFFVTSEKGYVEMAERIAREYARLSSEERP